MALKITQMRSHLDSAETLDTDSDGTGNNADTDDDNDGVEDNADAFGCHGSLDIDSDGTGNNADTDDDGDGVEDNADAFPLDSAETLDTDSDGTGNNADTDDDGDGVPDMSDDYPLNANVHTAPTATAANYSLNLLPKTTNSIAITLGSHKILTFSIVSNGSHGTATLTNASTGALTYSTTEADIASDSFNFKVNDGYVDSVASTISMLENRPFVQISMAF